MKKKKNFKLNDLYKVLKKHDVEILKHYNDDSIPDNDYFFYGINNDIISNSLNILTNYLSGNIESAGVDLSCRHIIEALVILHMDACGDISELQKRIYRYSYAYVDLDNYHEIMKDNLDEKTNEVLAIVYKAKEIATEAMTKHFCCTEKNLRNRKISIDDPCFYLKKSLNDDIRFSKLLEKYPVRNESSLRMYEFFSLFIHPRCEMDYILEENIMKVRENYIDNILDIVFEYLKACNLLSFEKDLPDFDHDFFYNPLLVNNVNNVKEMEYLIHVIKDQICDLPDGYDAFTWQFLERVRYLTLDMMTSLSLGYKEHVIACFKSFIEEYSVFYAVGSVNTKEEFDFLKKAYWLSSRVQLDLHLQELGVEKSLIDENEIKDLYNKYYKERYNPYGGYDKFIKEFKINSLYFLSDDKKSYNKYVKTLITDVFEDNDFASKDVMALYRFSKDMSHASGYCFNATDSLINVSSQKAIYYAYYFIKHFVINAAITLKEHNIDTNIKTIIGFLDSLLIVHYDEINRLLENQGNLK